MEFEDKMACTASKSPQMVSVKDAEALKTEAEGLRELLKEKLSAGDASGIVETQAQLRSLSPLILATEVAEIRRGIDACNTRLGELKPEVEYLEELLGERNKVLAEKIKEHEAAALAANKVSLALFQYDNEGEILRERRRTLQEKLDAFIKDADRLSGEII